MLITSLLVIVLLVFRPSGRVFKVLMQNVMVSKLAIGDIVTFSSEIIYKHTPVHAIIHRKRVDLTWKDVIQSTPHHEKMGIFFTSSSLVCYPLFIEFF